MKNPTLSAIIKKLLHQHKTNDPTLAPDIYQQPTWIYTNPDLFNIEIEKIFNNSPVMACLSIDLPHPGSFYTFDGLGVPILLVRNENLKIHAFLNACVHRGARLIEGNGTSNLFSCPYHAWSYDLNGHLKSVRKEHIFGRINNIPSRLTTFPVVEEYGLVFIAKNPETSLFIDEGLSEMKSILKVMKLEKSQYLMHEDMKVNANWKLALEGFFEVYHLPILHKLSAESGGPCDIFLYKRFGKNLRNHLLVVTGKSFSDLALTATKDLENEIFKYSVFNYFIYPNTCIVVNMELIEVYQIFPGEQADESLTRLSLYKRPKSKISEKDIKSCFQSARKLVFEEDYPLCEKVQRTINYGMLKFFNFGRNEIALADLHRTLITEAGFTSAEAFLFRQEISQPR